MVLVLISALLGYIVFSAISTSDTPKEALNKIIEQPQQNRLIDQEQAYNESLNEHQEKLIALENEHKAKKLETYENIVLKEKENETQVKLKELDNELNEKIVMMQVSSDSEEKSKSSATIIVIVLMLFLLLFIYLKYKKQLQEIELEKKSQHDEMIARKEFAETILAYINEGNISFETERKLLRMLDELNGTNVKTKDKDEIFHPNPDIIQLSRKSKALK
ncbi:MAG TPA: hypothetical protein ENK94_04455 [Campylobacterales bacterium]|nr:hypothetical protein [Campylobacterales bacterium]